MQKNQTYNVIGLMSGTSLDGLDIAFCRFSLNENWSFEILKSKTVGYNTNLKNQLKNCISLSESEISILDIELGKIWGEKVNEFIRENNIRADFIASHGHTVFHQPEKGLTLQIGNASEISRNTKLNVVYDFRTQDVALGGQGAPLVPIGDKLLFSDYDYCINLGGISNFSFDSSNGFRKAFDISPCNLVLNHYANQLGFEYDENGDWSKSGALDEHLLKELNLVPYYYKEQPKSLGKEDIVNVFLPIIEKYNISIQDRLRTFTEHVACQVGKQLVGGKSLFTGGGSYNKFLISRVEHYASSEIVLGSDQLISFKEAMIFAFLGVLRMRNEDNVLKSYTGAQKDSCSGKVITYKSNS